MIIRERTFRAPSRSVPQSLDGPVFRNDPHGALTPRRGWTARRHNTRAASIFRGEGPRKPTFTVWPSDRSIRSSLPVVG
jgi:hypothetical protein